MAKNVRIFAGVVLITLSVCHALQAQTCPGSSGCLDLTFGTAGFAWTTVNNQTASGWAVDVAVQADGKIVVAADSANVENTSAGDFYVLRFNSDGSLDNTFGFEGVTRFSFTAAADNETPWALAIQADGKILVAGTFPDGNAGLARLNPSGTLDSTFGSGGKVTFQFAKRQSAVPRKIALHPDGRITIAGSSNGTSFSFARFFSNGGIDTSLNGTGKFSVSIATKGNTGGLVDVVLQPDGKYVASGMNGATKGQSATWTLMRVNPNGGLDTTFGSGGIATTQFGGTWSVARNLAILPDGKILAGGDWLQSGTLGNQAYIFIRYKSNGQIDTTFGTSGKAVFNFDAPNFRRMEGMFVQADGKAVGSGWDRDPNISNANILIMRIDMNGNLDPTFGNGGVTLTDYLGRTDQGNAMAVQGDGKYVVAGGLNLGSNSPWLIGIVRYLP